MHKTTELEKINTIRQTLGLTQQELADMIGVDRRTVANWCGRDEGTSLGDYRKIMELVDRFNIIQNGEAWLHVTETEDGDPVAKLYMSIEECAKAINPNIEHIVRRNIHNNTVDLAASPAGLEAHMIIEKGNARLPKMSLRFPDKSDAMWLSWFKQNQINQPVKITDYDFYFDGKHLGIDSDVDDELNTLSEIDYQWLDRFVQTNRFTVASERVAKACAELAAELGGNVILLRRTLDGFFDSYLETTIEEALGPWDDLFAYHDSGIDNYPLLKMALSGEVSDTDIRWYIEAQNPGHSNSAAQEIVDGPQDWHITNGSDGDYLFITDMVPEEDRQAEFNAWLEKNPNSPFKPEDWDKVWADDFDGIRKVLTPEQYQYFVDKFCAEQKISNKWFR